jgi:hypothetical protein
VGRTVAGVSKSDRRVRVKIRWECVLSFAMHAYTAISFTSRIVENKNVSNGSDGSTNRPESKSRARVSRGVLQRMTDQVIVGAEVAIGRMPASARATMR